MKKEESYNQLITILIKSKGIALLRKKYDPHYNKKISNHVNLVYSFSGINQKALCTHIQKSISGIKPFNVKFNRFGKFKKNNYIYIISDNGLKKFMNLHKKLNSGLLKNVRNKDMPRYLPHITLTHFDSTAESNRFFETIKKEKLNFEVKIDSIKLLTQYKNQAIKSLKTFKLQ